MEVQVADIYNLQRGKTGSGLASPLTRVNTTTTTTITTITKTTTRVEIKEKQNDLQRGKTCSGLASPMTGVEILRRKHSQTLNRKYFHFYKIKRKTKLVFTDYKAFTTCTALESPTHIFQEKDQQESPRAPTFAKNN